MAARAMEEIAEGDADRSVRSVFVYVREAHPAENLPPHASMEQKRDHARQFRDEQNIKRPILLDDMTGTCHKAFGTLPNMTWLIGRGGVILYKAAWTRPDDVIAALEESWGGYQRRRQDDLMPAYSERMIWRAGDDDRFIELSKRAGPQAIEEMFGKEGLKKAYGEKGEP
jgi:hypothetical protein